MPLTPNQRTLARQSDTPTAKPLPPFPSLSDALSSLTRRFPELQEALADHDKNIASWVKSMQINSV